MIIAFIRSMCEICLYESGSKKEFTWRSIWKIIIVEEKVSLPRLKTDGSSCITVVVRFGIVSSPMRQSNLNEKRLKKYSYWKMRAMVYFLRVKNDMFGDYIILLHDDARNILLAKLNNFSEIKAGCLGTFPIQSRYGTLWLFSCFWNLRITYLERGTFQTIMRKQLPRFVRAELSGTSSLTSRFKQVLPA